jgi:glutamate synthase (NADPH/NADH) large chain
MMRKCHLNTCPVGIATQDPVLRKNFEGRPEHVVNYLFMVAEEARGYMAQLGIRTFNELIGRVDLLDTKEAVDHWKADGIDLSPVLMPALKPSADTGVFCQIEQDHGLDAGLDKAQLLPMCKKALQTGDAVQIELPVANTNRTVGTTLSHEVVKAWGEQGLPDDTILIRLNGSAGQSLGAWLANGVTIDLKGDANDYVGKGLSGVGSSCRRRLALGFLPRTILLLGMSVCTVRPVERHFSGAKPPSVSVSATVAQ